MSVSVPRPRFVSAPERVEDDVGQAPEIGIQELFQEHAPAVASVGFAMLQNLEEANDLVQDVFVKAWRALDRLHDREAAKPWLLTIAIRLAKTRLRYRKLEQFVLRVQEPQVEDVPALGSLPEDRELVMRLYQILDRLSIELRIAWVLRHVQEETVQGVAELCGWSLSTAKRRIKAAEARVAARLAALDPALPGHAGAHS